MIAIDTNGLVLVPEENDLYTGWRPSLEYKLMKTAKFHWKRAKIPFVMWEQVVCFLRWSQRKHKDEAMVTFFYNTKDDKWAVEVFPQCGRGMTVDLLEKDPEYAVLRAKYSTDWVQCGSVHHHCTMKAFMSGTDQADEKDRDGVHITLGEMTDPEVDTHIRVSFDGTMYNSCLFDWIQQPDWMELLPAYMLDVTNMEELIFALPDNVEFPEEWKARCRQGGPTLGFSPNSPLGEYNHDWEQQAAAHAGEKKPAGTTVLTGNGTKGTGSPAETTDKLIKFTGEMSHHLSNEGLDQKTIAVITEICHDMSLTIPGMRALLGADEADQKIMRETGDPDWHILTQLRAQIITRNISPLYIEAMLDRIL